MKVFAYYESLPSITPDTELIELWRRSWSRSGWEPVLLGRRDIAYEHLNFLRRMEASKELQRGPCPAGYNLACHVRWIAALSHAPGLFVDYDCLSNGFSPDDLAPHCIGDIPLFLSGNNCPCAVYATAAGARELVDTILLHAEQVDTGEYDPLTSTSELSMVAHDQAIFGRFAFKVLYPTVPLVMNYSQADDEWRHYKIQHYPNDTTPKPRGETIKTLNLFP